VTNFKATHQGNYVKLNWINALPFVAIALSMGYGAFRQWDASQAAKPDYEQNQSPPITTERTMPDSEEGRVARVPDGDTLTLEGGQKIRLCGIDAPEKVQPLGDESREFLQGLVQGKQVIVIPVESDRYGRLVAEVLIPGSPEVSVQEELLKAGMAYAHPQFIDRCWNGEVFESAEAIAIEQRQGVWAGDYQRPWDYRRQQREN